MLVVRLRFPFRAIPSPDLRERGRNIGVLAMLPALHPRPNRRELGFGLGDHGFKGSDSDVVGVVGVHG